MLCFSRISALFEKVKKQKHASDSFLPCELSIYPPERLFSQQCLNNDTFLVETSVTLLSRECREYLSLRDIWIPIIELEALECPKT
jgi:hypothetical protein